MNTSMLTDTKLFQIVEQPPQDMLTIISTVYCQRRGESPISYRLSSSYPINKSDEPIIVRKITLQPACKLLVSSEQLWMNGLTGICLVNKSETGHILYGFKGSQHYLTVLPKMFVVLTGPSTAELELWSSQVDTHCDIHFLPE